MKHRLADLIEYLSVPAFVFSLTRFRILASNSLMIKSYGPTLSEKLPLLIHGTLSYSSKPVYLKMSHKYPVPEIHVCKEKDASFVLMMFSKRTGIVFEMLHFHKSPLLGGKKVSSDDISPFHFSYMFNFVSGKWNYADTQTLEKLGLIEDAASSSFDWRRIILEDDIPLYDNTMSAVRQYGGNHEIQYRIRSASGKIINVQDYCSLTCPDGKWPVLVGSIICTGTSTRDISSIERQILTGRLVGGMIHDFKNLLGGIQNYIEWTISLTDNEDITKALRKTMSYTERATVLIAGALKASSRPRETKIQKIQLGEIIRDCEELIRHMLPSSINIVIKIADDLPPVYGKRSFLSDMLLNLCVNARDAMKEKGAFLLIEAALKQNTGEGGPAQNFICLKVEDDGCGMSKVGQKEIFDAFYSTKENGAGLGLWMVREAVRAFDGHIELSSNPGKGTSFEILFPVVERDFPEETFEEPAPAGTVEKISHDTFSISGPKTIFFVEDDPLIRGSVSNWLEAFGFNLIVCSDGSDAWRVFKKEKDNIDVIIQDLILPGRKGDQLLVDFKALSPDIPVIIASAEPDEDQMEVLMRKGAAAILSKPFRMEELVRILSAVIRK
ncbi:MAG: hypothetical protein A2020_02420 [Lentisphaerae bacterium GWF2_45_14]|nr:MAG: hypothetical protein A2020_02420 [Lentisphaerae bacterium GWF2_45_14]